MDIFLCICFHLWVLCLYARQASSNTFYLESLANNEQYKIRYKNFGINDGTTESLMNRVPKTHAHTHTRIPKKRVTQRFNRRFRQIHGLTFRSFETYETQQYPSCVNIWQMSTFCLNNIVHSWTKTTTTTKKRRVRKSPERTGGA